MTNRKRLGSIFESLKVKLFRFILTLNPEVRSLVADDFIENNLSSNNSRMLRNLLKFNECAVKDIMVPRSEVYAIDSSFDKERLIKSVIKEHYTRIPVYNNNLDNIEGFIHIKDVLSNLNNNFIIKDIKHDVIFVPPSMKAIDLFVKMQSSHIHIAIVLDEYGGTEGLVTMADIIEEIVGNIDDEHDVSAAPDFTRISDTQVETAARVLVKTLEEDLNIKLRESNDEDYVTIGGLILSMIGRVPAVDEVFQHKSGAVFVIKESDNRCIHKIVIDLSKYTNEDTE